MEDNFKKEKNKFNYEKYIPNTTYSTQSEYGFGRRRLRKEQEPEKIVKKEETTIRKIEQKTSLTTKNDKRLGRSRKKLEEPKKEEKNSQYSKYKIAYSTTTRPAFEGKQKKEHKKEETSYKRNYYRKYNRGIGQEKKEEPKKAKRSSELAYTSLYKKANFKLDDNKNNRIKENSEQNRSYYSRFSKEIYRQNTDNNNTVKNNKNEKDNNENKLNRFVYRGRYSKNNTNEDNNNHKKSENVINKKYLPTKNYNITHGVKLTPKSITTTIANTSDIRMPTDYTSRRRIQQQKEIKLQQTKVKNIDIKIKERYNYKDSFLIGITDQNKIEEYLINLKNSNDIEEYYNMLLYYYPILSPKICQKYQIEKVKTEKETFFDIINKLIEKYGDKDKNENLKESDLCKYVSNILESPAKEELKKIKNKEIPSRWNYIYCKIVRFETETNEELIFYNLSNDLLNNIKDSYRAFDTI